MSVVKPVLKPVSKKLEGTSLVQNDKIAQCCGGYVLVNAQTPGINPEGNRYVNCPDAHAGSALQQLREVMRERDSLITGLQMENMFLKEQVRSLNALLDQLSNSMINLATKNDIQIKVENSSNVTLKRWYREPRVILSGSVVVVLFSIYLRHKLKYMYISF